MATGESKILEIFHRQESIDRTMLRLLLAYAYRYGSLPVLGGMHSKYKALMAPFQPLDCGGYELHGIHWHFVHMDYGDKHNITEMFVCNHDYTKFEGI